MPRFLIHTLGDVHVYLNHIDGLRLQLTRSPGALPVLQLSDRSVLEQKFEDIHLCGYNPQAFIKFPIAV